MNQLSRPWGIFVDINLNLYVADFDNNRVQMFRPGELDGVTVAGAGIPNGLTLQWPSDVVVDGHNQLYIADNRNHRIIRVINGDYQCLAGGCLYGSGSSSNQMNQTFSLRLDSIGNMYVADEENHRIQKFVLLSDCGRKCIRPCPVPCRSILFGDCRSVNQRFAHRMCHEQCSTRVQFSHYPTWIQRDHQRLV